MTSADSHELLFDDETASELEKDRAWWSIYEESIPANEREPTSVILKGVERHVSKALRARLNGETVGMANIHLFHHPSAVLLYLLAVAPAKRDRHIGGKLMEYAFQHGMDTLEAKGFSPIGMVWEVDDPALAKTASERESSDRRISFYEKHEGILLPCTYMQPPLREGDAPLPMRLMFRPREAGYVPDAATCRDLIWALYFEKYCAINALDETMLHRLFEEIT